MPRRPNGERRQVPDRAEAIGAKSPEGRSRPANLGGTMARDTRRPGAALPWPLLTFAILVWSAGGANAQEPSAENRGEYVFHAGGCFACHTDVKQGGAPLAGGPPLKTPFGTFYAPNITPDPLYGIGRWSDADFLRALREGKSPKGEHYYPVFPYTSYTKASDRDLLDLKAYLFSRAAVARPSRPHDVGFPFGWRFLLGFWKMLNFHQGRFRPDSERPAAWNRGAYLVEALAHCGECHTPRNLLGGLDHARWMAGSRDGAPGEVAPDITPHTPQGIGAWTQNDVASLLRIGITPDGSPITGAMRLVVEHSTSKLTPADRMAIVAYLIALPPLPSAARK